MLAKGGNETRGEAVGGGGRPLDLKVKMRMKAITGE